MPRLWIGNFDFEHELAQPGLTLSANLQRLNAELATSWLAVAEEGDEIWTPEAIPDSFWQELPTRGLPAVRPCSLDLSRLERDAFDLPEGRLPVWWGGGADTALEIVRRANSRRWSAQKELDWGIAPDGLTIAATLADVEQAVTRPELETRWLIKAEYGMSGRERRAGQGPLSDADRAWLRRRLVEGRIVVIEPWLNRVAEAGLQFEITDTGETYFLGRVEMLASRNGQYAGSVFAGTVFREESAWEPAERWGLKAARELAAKGYRGPLGIDAMLYDHAGEPRIRPLQDVNARWTMGRLTLGWRSHFPEANQGYWWQGSARDFAAGEHLQAFLNLGGKETPRVVRTSSEMVGGRPSGHVAAVVWR